MREVSNYSKTLVKTTNTQSPCECSIKPDVAIQGERMCSPPSVFPLRQIHLQADKMQANICIFMHVIKILLILCININLWFNLYSHQEYHIFPYSNKQE